MMHNENDLLTILEIEYERDKMKSHAAMLPRAHDDIEKNDILTAIEQSRAVIEALASDVPIAHDRLNRVLIEKAVEGAILHCLYEHETVTDFLKRIENADRDERLRVISEHSSNPAIYKWLNNILSLVKSGKIREVVSDARADFEWCVGERDEALNFDNCAEVAGSDPAVIKRMLLMVRDKMSLDNTLTVLERWNSGEMGEAL